MFILVYICKYSGSNAELLERLFQCFNMEFKYHEDNGSKEQKLLKLIARFNNLNQQSFVCYASK